MYFVVYAVDYKQYVALPITWIHNFDLVDMVNDVPNCNKRYNCYDGDDDEAWIENEPNERFIPRFDVQGDNNFIAQLMRFFGM